MAGQYQDVMVLFHHCRDKRAAVWCEERGWKYHWEVNIFGCEAQCVVLLDCYLHAELITRARNMLIMIKRWLLNNSPSLCSIIWCVNYITESGVIFRCYRPWWITLMRNINVRRCQTVPTPAPPSSTRYPGLGRRTLRTRGLWRGNHMNLLMRPIKEYGRTCFCLLNSQFILDT